LRFQNKRFRVIIQGLLDKYAEASGKTEKSRIVSKAMNIIREKCSNGGAFVKKEKTGWFEVSARYSREKGMLASSTRAFRRFQVYKKISEHLFFFFLSL